MERIPPDNARTTRSHRLRGKRPTETPAPLPVKSRQEERLPRLVSPPPCSRCHGAGYLRANVPFGHPQFGKPLPCICKENERKEQRQQQLRALSNLDAYRSYTFSTFHLHVAGVQDAYKVTRAYAQRPEGWLLMVGPYGSGKTHLVAALANECLDQGMMVLFQVVPDLLDHLRAAFAPTSTEGFDELFWKMREAEVLILDDLGSQHSSPWANEKLFQLLNYRYVMEMPTVMTANPKGLRDLDERLRSRLGDVGLVTVIDMDQARDYRPYLRKGTNGKEQYVHRGRAGDTPPKADI